MTHLEARWDYQLIGTKIFKISSNKFKELRILFLRENLKKALDKVKSKHYNRFADRDLGS